MAKKIGSLWKNVKVGENYPVATGIIEPMAGYPIRVALFKNTKKVSGSKQPDYTLVISEPQRQQETTRPDIPKIIKSLQDL